MKTIKISFDQEVILHIKLNQNDFVSKWVALLEDELQTKEILQLDTFSSFFTEEESRQHLRDAIQTVNNFLKVTFIELPSDNDLLDPNYYNLLHEKFEKLAGPDWSNPTRLMVVSPKQVQLAVRHINRFCHRLEYRPYTIAPYLRVEFDSSKRLPLDNSDYELFEAPTQTDCVYLDYSTLGKNLYECYQDNLDPNYGALKLQENYCANFVLKFNNTSEPKARDGYKDWLIAHSLDPVKIKGSGQIPLGYIVEQNQLNSVIKCRKINKITLE
jgi:hypothetical protein